MRLKVLAVASLLLLSACGAYQRQQAQQAAAERSAAVQKQFSEAKAQCAALFDNPAIDPVRTKITIFDPDEAPLAQLSDSSRPSSDDRPAIDAYETARRKCAVIQLHVAMGTLPSEGVRAVELAQSRSWDLSKQLYAGEVTYGAFNTARATNASQLKLDLNAADERAHQQFLENQRRADEAQRERQSAALAVMAASMAARPAPAPAPIIPYIPPPTPTVYTTCNQFGSMTNCVSR